MNVRFGKLHRSVLNLNQGHLWPRVMLNTWDESKRRRVAASSGLRHHILSPVNMKRNRKNERVSRLF
jgi:hypothetical protein